MVSNLFLYNVPDFVTSNVQGVRFWIEKFATRQILITTFLKVSEFQLKYSHLVGSRSKELTPYLILSRKIIITSSVKFHTISTTYTFTTFSSLPPGTFKIDVIFVNKIVAFTIRKKICCTHFQRPLGLCFAVLSQLFLCINITSLETSSY